MKNKFISDIISLRLRRVDTVAVGFQHPLSREDSDLTLTSPHISHDPALSPMGNIVSLGQFLHCVFNYLFASVTMVSKLLLKTGHTVILIVFGD